MIIFRPISKRTLSSVCKYQMSHNKHDDDDVIFLIRLISADS